MEEILIYDLNKEDIEKYKTQIEFFNQFYKLTISFNLKDNFKNLNVNVNDKNVNVENNEQALLYVLNNKDKKIIVLTKDKEFYCELRKNKIDVILITQFNELVLENIFKNAYSYYLLSIEGFKHINNLIGDYKTQKYKEVKENPRKEISIELLDFDEAKIVNLSLSCELFLKGILCKENKYPKGHSLSQLFNSINNGTQTKILDSLCQSLNGKKTDIILKLYDVSNYFITKRYWQEKIITDKDRNKDTNAIKFLKNFADVLIKLFKEELNITEEFYKNLSED